MVGLIKKFFVCLTILFYPLSVLAAQISTDLLNLVSLPLQVVFQDAVDSVCHGTDDCIIQPLKAGYSKAILFTIQNQDRKYVLKFSDSKFSSNQMIRAFLAQKIASDLGLAPKVYFADPNGLALLSRFVEGNHAGEFVKNHRESLSLFPRAFRRLHSTQALPKVFTVFDEIRSLNRELEIKNIPTPQALIEILSSLEPIERALNKFPDFVLSHGDAVPVNIMIDEKSGTPQPLFIDWDNARSTFRFEDQAIFSLFLRLDDQEKENWVREYLESDTFLPTGTNPKITAYQYWSAQRLVLELPALTKGGLWAFHYASLPETSSESKLSESELDQLLLNPEFTSIREYSFPRRKLTPVDYQELGVRCLKQVREDWIDKKFQDAYWVLDHII